MQLLDLAADLRAHIDQLRGLNGAGCQHGIFNIPALDRCGNQGCAGWFGKPDFVSAPQQKQHKQAAHCEPPWMGFEFFPHSEKDMLLLEMKRWCTARKPCLLRACWGCKQYARSLIGACNENYAVRHMEYESAQKEKSSSDPPSSGRDLVRTHRTCAALAPCARIAPATKRLPA